MNQEIKNIVFVLLAMVVSTYFSATVHAGRINVISTNTSYSYSSSWPGTPNTWPDTTPPTKLTDGDNENLVIEAGNESFFAYNFVSDFAAEL